MKKNEKSHTWRPILEGSEAEKAFGTIEEIAAGLHDPPTAWMPGDNDGAEPYRIIRSASLAHGSSGIALFYAYLSQVPGAKPVYAEETDRFIQHACNILETAPMPGGLYRGLSGIAWTVRHLHDFFYDSDPCDPEDDPLAEIDRVLLEHLSKPEKFDLWEGCVGIGVYGLERYPLPGSKILLESLINRLEQLATLTDKGLTWFISPKDIQYPLRLIYPEGYYDLGAAHGVSGIISFIARAYVLGISPEITKKLLFGAASWLLAQQRQKNRGPLFPEILMPVGREISVTGGWCHGDIGIAAALFSAACSIDEPSWKTKAVEIAYASRDYLNEKFLDSNFNDPTLCHGTAGLGHLFNRLYQKVGDKWLKDEARKWFDVTLKMRNQGTGVAGFSRYGLNEDGEMQALHDPGFIQGAAGIGLALLGAVTDIEPKWDRVMLISG